ncbi:ABC transporter substrate-binding protein [Paenibacillus sedimenti]|uniref:Extracellular solute-binding protein n=1 Tax=Paenibacillus sedimenti TaxID=2770274 RepID=A0A926KU66_9BACL|nr:extracellular solute-binding protein [Paenibacillus sedimenti]MBD0382956.1 extracellular solute-binding protein [Paenibacillus sedimenti]
MGFWVNKFLLDYVYSQDTDWNRKRSAGQVSWTDAGPAEAMKELAALWKNGYVEPGFLSIADNQTASYLVSGKAAMLYSGPWMFKQIEEADPNFEIGFFALPDRKGTRYIFGLPQPTGWAISSDAANDPNRLKFIKQFLHFFYSSDEYRRYLEAVSGIPATKEAIPYKTTEPMQKVLDIINDSRSVKLHSLEHYWGENHMPPAFRNIFYKLITDYLADKISLDEMLLKADQAWDNAVVQQ